MKTLQVHFRNMGALDVSQDFLSRLYMSKRAVKTAKGYLVKGKHYKVLRASGPGARRQVWNETAYKTDGTPGLTKADLIKNKRGRLVSKKKFNIAKSENRLNKYGWTAEKGKFGAVRISENANKKTRKKGKQKKGKTRHKRGRR